MRTLTPIPPEASLVAWMIREPQAYAYAELVAVSGERRLRTAVARGEIERMLPGVYAASIHAESFRVRCDAALMWAGKEALLAGTSALHLWEVVEEPPAKTLLTVPRHFHRPTPPWLGVRRLATPPKEVWLAGWRTVPPAVAIVQGFGALPKAYRTETVYKMLRAGLMSAADLQRALQSMPRVGGRRRLASIAGSFAGGAESALESEGMRRIFASPEFAHLIPQHTLRANCANYRVDLYDARSMTAIEFDGYAFHGGPAQRQRDLARDIELAALGVLTLRFTFADVMHRPGWCRDRVRAVMRERVGSA